MTEEEKFALRMYKDGYYTAIGKVCEWLLIHDNCSENAQQLVKEIQQAMEE